MKYLMGLDNGGSDIKCALFDLQGKEIAVSAVKLKIDTPEPGFTERNSEEVWEANIWVIRDVLENSRIDPKDIAAIGISAYGNGLVFVDENIETVYPLIVSTDERAAEYVRRFKEEGIERKLFPYIRQTIWSAQPAVLLPWFKDHKPEVLNKTRWILSLKDYLRYRLTGSLYGELTEASSTGLFNLESRQYETEVFKILKIDDCLDKFPAVKKSTEIAGYINAKTAKLTGLSENTPVAAGYFDIDANALGSGILDDEELCMIAGTWSINEYLTKEATADYDKRTNTATLSYLDGYYLMEDSSPTSASNFNWYIEKIIRKYNPALSHEEIYDLCNKAVSDKKPQDSSVIFVPYLYGSATAPDTAAAFLNMKAGDDDASLLRAIYEGVVFSSVHHVHNLQRDINTYRLAKLSGGLSNSAVWSQMMADALQIKIQTLEGTQTGAKGAAIGAGLACGVFTDLKQGVEQMVINGKEYLPNKENAEIYRIKYARYEAALAALDELSEKVR